MDFLHELFRYFAYLWGGITHALRLDPGVFAFVEEYPQSAWVVAGIVFLAGASTLLGQSAVLFINRVRKSRFVISLITNGLIFIVSYIVWGFIVWLVGRLLFNIDPPLGPVRAHGRPEHGAAGVRFSRADPLDGPICRQGAQRLEPVDPDRQSSNISSRSASGAP